jgi:hypothetical protein
MKESILLTIDGILDLLFGAVLLAYPKGLVSFLGLPQTGITLYPGVLGGILVGVGAGLVLQQLLDRPIPSRGVEIPIITNLGGAGALIALLAIGGLQIPLKGHIVLWVVAIVVLATAVAEIYFHFAGRREHRVEAGEPLQSEQ